MRTDSHNEANSVFASFADSPESEIISHPRNFVSLYWLLVYLGGWGSYTYTFVQACLLTPEINRAALVPGIKRPFL
jgi:hypothetical protein